MERAPATLIVSILLGLLCVPATKAAPPAFPIVPGYHILKDSGKVDAAAQGELLLSELNCVACHAAPAGSRVQMHPGPDLSRVGARISPQYLQRYLSDTHGVKPGTTMPDLLHGQPDRAAAAEAITHFLVDTTGGAELKRGLTVGTPEQLKQGEELYGKVGCAACHSAGKAKPTTLPSVPLGNLAEKSTVTGLTAFLLDPSHFRPAGRMPGMGLTPIEAKSIAVYLLRKQLDSTSATSQPTQPIPGTGLQVEYFEADFKSAEPAKFEGLKGVRKPDAMAFNLEAAGKKPKAHFGLKFTGWIAIPQDGKYTFNLKSDDGSILFIDQKLVVNYDGIHPNKGKKGDIELAAGIYPIQLTYFQNAGTLGLEVLWSGPGFTEVPVPADVLAAKLGKPMTPVNLAAFTADHDKAATGSRLFASAGCAACHAMKDRPSELKAKPLVELNTASPVGCLAEAVGPIAPQFDLSPDQRAAIIAALKNSAAFSSAREPAAQVLQTLAAMGCLACHQRNEIGGVAADRNDLFKLGTQVDVGDEGRIPPRLTGIGAKLQPTAIEKIVHDRQLHVRPYMATRMPNFSRAALPGLAELLVKADGAGLAGTKPAEVIAGEEKIGRTLVGVRGYGCVNCHGVKGAKSLGAPSVDLSFVKERLQPGWFAAYLLDPNKLNPGTRMPSFWPDGEPALKDIGGGTFIGQSNAIWSYLQHVEDLPLPDGLRLNGSDELVPGDEPITLRAFVTGVSPRSILVGNPQGLHFVFDANTVRLAKAWRGRFFDAKGIWEARGGRAEPPMGTDVIDMPIGPSFAVLDSLAAPWPQANGEFDRNQGGRFLGYRLDEKQQPTFRYALGDMTVEEKPLPWGTGDHASLQRQFSVTAAKPVKEMYFLIASGKMIRSMSEGKWLIDGKQTVTLKGTTLPPAQVRDDKDGVKLLVMPIDPGEKPLLFTVETSW